MADQNAKPAAPQRPLLMHAYDMLHPDLEDALESIFARFDKDRDGYLNLDELQAFAVAVHGNKFDVNQLSGILTHHAVQGRRPNVMLCVDGFIDMYYHRTQADEDDVWRDLATLGYGPDLQLVDSEREQEQRSCQD